MNQLLLGRSPEEGGEEIQRGDNLPREKRPRMMFSLQITIFSQAGQASKQREGEQNLQRAL